MIMTVKIGSVDLHNVLNWEEDDLVTIPIKRPVGRKTPTSQSKFFTRTPKNIVITARVTPTEKTSIRALKNEFAWQPLYDYDDSFIDYVWIEKLTHDWRGDVDRTCRWLSTLYLICSQT